MTEPTTSATETGSTSGPAPECQSDGDCEGFCEYCVDGECYDAVGCCGVIPGPHGQLELRCQGYECYGDEDCDDGEECHGDPGWCEPIAAIPACERQPLTLSAIPLQGPASALALADLDADGALDLVAVLPDQGQVEVMLGDGLGGFAPGTVFDTGLAAGTQRLAIADFDGNGSQDLAVTLAIPLGELSLLFGQDAVFADPVKQTIGPNPARVWAGDFDGDGAPDLLTHDDDLTAPIGLRLGDGMGGFGEPFGAEAVRGSMFAAGVGALVGEPNRLDLLVSGADVPLVDVFEFASGSGLVPLVALTAAGEWPVTSLSAGDVDGDGLVDVIGHRAPFGLELLTIWAPNVAGPDLRVEGPVQLGPVADVDADGAGELVTGSTAAVRLIYVSGGDGPCVQAHALAGDTATELLAAGDVDGDGRSDVVAGEVGLAEVALLRSGP